MKSSDIDDLLEIIENPLRREILIKLSKEGHYPLQLSKELKVSQQAIMKHLKILEEFGLVSCSEEKSDCGGPPRKIYASKKQFSIRIDVGPSIFRNELYMLDDEVGSEESSPQLTRKYNEILHTSEIDRKLAKTCTLMREIDKEIEEIEKRRNSLVRFKEHILEEANNMIRNMCDSYRERQLLYLLMDSNEEDVPSVIPGIHLNDFDDLDVIFEKIIKNKILIQK
jgi:predicted transcriptional regulator